MSDHMQIGVRVAYRLQYHAYYPGLTPTTHLAIPLDTPSLARLRIAADVEIGSIALKTGYGYVPVDEVRDAVFRALGLEAVIDP